MNVVKAPAEERQLLSGVSWERYEELLHQYDGRHIRLTYDSGNLEIMTVSMRHERAKKFLARLLEAFTEELDIPILGLGNTTYKREDAAKGLEPDECWYIKHEAQMRDKEAVDVTTDPPPDLVIEVEISQSVLNRLAIYARLGVPEIWRFDGETLLVCLLSESGEYVEVNRSLNFPQLPLEGLKHFFSEFGRIDETSLVKAFRKWVRDTLVHES